MQVTQPGGQLWNQTMQVTSPDDQILNQFASGAIWWPNLELKQVAPSFVEVGRAQKRSSSNASHPEIISDKF